MKPSKTKLSLPVIILVLAAAVLMVGANQAEATVNYYQATTWNAGVGNITITASSSADTVITTNTTMVVNFGTGQKFTLTSAAGNKLNNDGGYTPTCDSSGSTLILTSTSSKSVTITPSSTTCSTGGGSSSGGTTTATPTPTPTPSTGGGGGDTTTVPATTPVSTPTPSSTPAPSVSASKPTPASKGFVNLTAVSLKDGDVISAAGSSDPDVYIVNPNGYKRLFLNPVIFGFYGHLGGFSKVKSTTSTTRDVFVTSGLFRNCETNDVKVYGVETTGEDTGTLHWVNTSGSQAVADDPNFFKKVFCINTKEFSWYQKGADYTSVNQVPDYARAKVSSSSTSPTPTVNKKYKVVSSVGYLNVRALANTTSAILGKLNAGAVIESLSQSGIWHKIKFESKDGWVHGDYLQMQ